MQNISARFRTEMAKEVQTFRAQMHVLDTDFNIVEDGEIHDVGDPGVHHPETSVEGEDLLIDANVDIDTTRQARRTFTATVLNPEGIFSPGSNWGGMFYVNRLIRLFRGLDFGDSQELVPVGTFMIDHADVNVERGMSIVVLSGTDQWKRLSRSAFSAPTSWAAGTSINTVIKAMGDAAGVTRYNLDPLSERSTNAKQLSSVFAVDRGDYRGDAIRQLADSYGIDVYFDPLGVFTTQDFNTPTDQAVVWEYISDQTNNLIQVQYAITDEKLYNSILVVGTADKENVVVSTRKNTDPSSPTNITRLGERTLKFESDAIGTQAAADAAATKLFFENVLVSEDITLDVICNPAFEGNDVIRLREDEFSRVNSTYRLKAFTIPMSTSKQALRLQANVPLSTT